MGGRAPSSSTISSTQLQPTAKRNYQLSMGRSCYPDTPVLTRSVGGMAPQSLCLKSWVAMRGKKGTGAGGLLDESSMMFCMRELILDMSTSKWRMHIFEKAMFAESRNIRSLFSLVLP